ncbi:MAG: outer membrane protein assembly factor BamA [Myxococcales bacterium]|nr:MAG: outer membrane protein assembly factor BamA [Myxococcales bacterium]
MMRGRMAIIVVLLMFALQALALAAEDGVIAGVRIQGLARVEEEAVRLAIGSRAGQPYSLRGVQDDLKAIYGLGYFIDVQVDRQDTDEGVWLTYIVEERPSIKEVKIEGNDEVDEDDITEVIDIKPFSVLSYDKIYRNIDKIKNVYIDKGFFLADVDFKLVPQADNQTTLIFQIREHAKVVVKKIIILGNKKLTDDELKKQMLSKPGDALSFLTSSGNFRQEMVERDAYMISTYYADHGYINAKVSSPKVSLSPDRKWVYITIKVTEGEQYFMGELDFSGDLLFPKEKLKKKMTLEKGDVFNRSLFIRDMEAVSALYKDLGYAYANVSPLTTPHEDNKQIDIDMRVQKGRKVWIERINVVGNTKTRDKVVRREMRIAEGDLYNVTAIEKSKRKIYQLGYFEKVEITEEAGSDDAKIVLNVEVKEQRTGTFQLGFGFSSLESFVFQAQINQANLFGRGQTLTLNAQVSSIRKQFMLRFFEPYFLDSKVNFGFSVFNQSITFPRQGEIGSYSRTSTGADVTLGYPVWEDISLFLTYSIRDVNLAVGNDINIHLFKSGLTSSLRFTTQYDSRDNRLFPTDGMLHQASVEVADSWTGSEIEFMKYTLTSRYYFPVYWKLVFSMNYEAGYVTTLEEPFADLRGKKDFPGVPIAERYLLGGIYSIRGFEFGSISPTIQIMTQDDPAGYPIKYRIGGNKMFQGNFELEFPLIEVAGIKWVFFYDAGNTWSEEQQFFYLGQSGQNEFDLPLGLYMSWGFGFRWYSPIGPLRFEWGLPITKRPEDDDIAFEFSIGNQF